MTNVFYEAVDFAEVGPDWIERLKAMALSSPLRRSRLCLHRSDADSLHEMIIALAYDCLFPPHRHPTKTESYHIIQGRFVLIIFSDEGLPVRSVLLSTAGKGALLCFRLSKPAFHAVLPLDKVVVFHEVTNGPFRKDEAVLASWAPSKSSELRSFLERAATLSGIPDKVIGMPQ